MSLRFQVIDASRTINDDVELITSLMQKYGLPTFKGIIDKALEKVMIAEKEQLELAKQKEKETAGQNEARLNSLWCYSRLFNANSVNPEALKEWLKTRKPETLQKILSEIKQNLRGNRDIFKGNVAEAITTLETAIANKSPQSKDEPKDSKGSKRGFQKIRDFIS